MTTAKRYMFTGVVLLGSILSLVFVKIMQWIIDRIEVSDPVLWGIKELSMSHFLGFALGAVLVAVLLSTQSTYSLAIEITEELLRVTWPSKEEIIRATWIVIVAVLFSSLYLGIIDSFWLWFTNMALGISTAKGS